MESFQAACGGISAEMAGLTSARRRLGDGWEDKIPLHRRWVAGRLISYWVGLNVAAYRTFGEFFTSSPLELETETLVVFSPSVPAC
jgi:hypothetical protein